MIHIILISIIAFAYLSRKSRRIQNFSFVLIAIVAAIRYMYGNDYFSYMQCHYWIRNGVRSPFDREILYTVLNKAISSFYVLIAITSILFIYIIYRFIAENVERKYVWVALFIFLMNPYLFLMNLSAIRQCIAMCIYIIALEDALRGRRIRFVIYILIASLFHKSVIVLLPTIFIINYKKVDVKRIITILCITSILLFFTDLPILVETIANVFSDNNYLTYVQGGGNSLRATLLSSVYLVYVLFNLPELEGKYLVYGKLYLCSTILAILAFKVSMLTRTQMYFDIFSIVVLPYLFSKNKMTGRIAIYQRSLRKTIWGILNQYLLPVLIFMIYLLRYYSFFTNPMWQSFVKYRTILDLL